MEPLTTALLIGGAAQAVSGIMQFYNQRKQAGATKAQLKKIEEMFNAIVPPEYDLKVFDDPRLAEDIPAPKLNLEAITPELYQQVGQYIPQVADYVQEANPELIKATEAARTGRGAQLDALERYRAIAGGEFDPELQQMLSEASQRANTEAQSRSASILQDAQRRGQLGSGMMLAEQQRAAAEAMARQARESQMAAAEGYRNRLLALDKSASLGGQIRGSEMAEEGRNVDILNDFNQRTSKNYQDYLQMRANEANKARIMETERARSVADANVSAQNQAARQNRDMFNQGQMTQYDVRRQNRSNRLDLEDRKNRMKQQMYENLLSQAKGKAGIAETKINYDTQAMRDTNQTIRGLGDAASAGALYYGKYGKPDAVGATNMPGEGRVNPGEDDRYAYPF